MEGNDVSRVGELALAWLLTRPEGKGARSGLSRALKPFTENRWTAAEWNTHLDETLSSLEAGGLVQQTARKGLCLTREGRERALARLGLKSAKGLTWTSLKSTRLMALALGLELSPEKVGRLGSADGLRAVLVQKQLQLGDVGAKSLAQVRDALCWKQLGVETDRPFTLAAVQGFLLGKVLQASRETPPAQALQQLAARGVGSRRVEVDSLRLAALQGYVAGGADNLKLQAGPAPAPAPAETLKHFAEQVLQAARTATTGRYGEDKVFISHVWRSLQGRGVDEQAFKNQLLEANRQRYLSLSRADLVEAMDPADVAASEVRYLGATFHFIAL